MFITFEGLEGSGKSTQVGLLHDYLSEKGHDVFQTREPGGCHVAEKIRSIALNTEGPLAKTTEALLFIAARAQLVAEIIRPKLAAGCIVLCDRYIDSTITHQGFGNGLDIPSLKFICDFATGGLMPDITILLQIEPGAGLGRKAALGELDRIEQKGLDYHMAVKKGYDSLIGPEGGRIRAFDARLPAGVIHNEIKKHIDFEIRRRFNETDNGHYS